MDSFLFDCLLRRSAAVRDDVLSCTSVLTTLGVAHVATSAGSCAQSILSKRARAAQSVYKSFEPIVARRDAAHLASAVKVGDAASHLIFLAPRPPCTHATLAPCSMPHSNSLSSLPPPSPTNPPPTSTHQLHRMFRKFRRLRRATVITARIMEMKGLSDGDKALIMKKYQAMDATAFKVKGVG